MIEAVVSHPSESKIGNQLKHSWPWIWNGKEAVVPSDDQSGETGSEPVYRLRVCGTPDLELLYEIVQPDGTTDSLFVGLRRAIGLVRLSGDDRNDRDLRLVQGSALDRLLSDKGLRSRVANDLAVDGIKDKLDVDAKKALDDLDEAFKKESLPSGLDIAINGSQGFSVGAMIDLTAVRTGIPLPLTSWGAGTRRIAALAIAQQNQGEAPITLVDEVERGLEPYRQRALMEKLQAGKSQVFMTTHSPFAIAAATNASIWYVDHEGHIGELEGKKSAMHRKNDPETFLARLSVIAEGATECGFVATLLERAFCAPIEQHGVYVSDGTGHETTLGLLEALSKGGLCFGGFADDEGKHPERWEKLVNKLGKLLFRWNSGCLEENVIGAVSDENLEKLIINPADDKTRIRLRNLWDRLGLGDGNIDFETIKAKAGNNLKAIIVMAATGAVPQDKEAEKNKYQGEAKNWFKTADGGRELAEKMFTLDTWSTLKKQLLPFCNAVRTAVNLPEKDDVVS